MGVQIHMRHGNGEYNNSYARIEDMEIQHDNEEYNDSYARVEDTGVQIHMRPCAQVEDFVDDRDVVIHAKGSCDPCIKKEKEVIANDYNLDINKPKINGIELVGNKTTEDLLIDRGFSEIQVSNSEPTNSNIKLWYQIDSDEGGDING